MEKDQSKKQFIIWILLIIIIIAIGALSTYAYLAFGSRLLSLWPGGPAENVSVSVPAAVTPPPAKETIEAAGNLVKCGTWPIANVPLSAGRGNPFSKKPVSPGQPAATGTELNLPSANCVAAKDAIYQ